MSHLCFDNVTANLDLLCAPVKLISVADGVMLWNEDFWTVWLSLFELSDVGVDSFVATLIAFRFEPLVMTTGCHALGFGLCLLVVQSLVEFS